MTTRCPPLPPLPSPSPVQMRAAFRITRWIRTCLLRSPPNYAPAPSCPGPCSTPATHGPCSTAAPLIRRRTSRCARALWASPKHGIARNCVAAWVGLLSMEAHRIATPLPPVDAHRIATPLPLVETAVVDFHKCSCIAACSPAREGPYHCCILPTGGLPD